MDFQPAVLASLTAGSEGLLNNAERALRWARTRGVRVAHVRIAFRESDLDAIPIHNKAFGALKGRKVLLDGTVECDIIDRLRPAAGEIVVRKTRVGSFSTTDLADQLQDARINTLILAGIKTSGVILSTVRDASDRDFSMYVLRDACADTDVQVHDLLTTRIFPYQAEVVMTADLDMLT